MRFLAPAATLAALANAAPRPQDIDYASVLTDVPEPTFSYDPAAKPTIITFDPSAIVQSVASEVTAAPLNRRDNSTGCSTCTSLHTTPNSYNVNLLSAAAFRSDANIAALASSVPVPAGYTKSYTNLNAASNGYVSLGFDYLTSYTPSICATKCSSLAGCISFNIYFERAPVVDLCSTTCTNADATANIKCAYWGGPVDSLNAQNTGQILSEFEVAVAGSNGYVTTAQSSILGYSAPTVLGNATINAPHDCNNVDTYMGDKLFTGVPYDVALCSALCDATSAYNLRHPPKVGAARTCQFFTSYLLNKNGISQGQYCAMYTEAWNTTYATNLGQWRGTDKYTMSYSFAYTNATNSGSPICPSDIAYLQTEGADFCTSFNSYIAPVTAISVVSTASPTLTVDTTATFTTTPVAATFTETSISYVDSAAARKRQEGLVAGYTISIVRTFSTTYPEKANATATSQLEKRAIATPQSILTWQSSRIAAACSLVATGTLTSSIPYTTSTIYQSTATSIITSFVAAPTPTSTVTVQSTSTRPAPPAGVVLSDPIAISGSLQGAPYEVDDSYWELQLPFAIGAFGVTSTNVFVSSNGLLTLNSGTATWTNAGLPYSYFTYPTVAGYWDDLYIYGGTAQGIYYQITGSIGQRTVTFEYFVSHFSDSQQYYHFTMTFYENQSGVIVLKYFEVSDSGVSATVGAQSGSQYLAYSYNQAIITPGLMLTLNTIAGTVTSSTFSV